MKFHSVQMVGRFNVESKTSLPTFDGNRDKGRLVYNESDDKVYFGTTSEWLEVSSSTDLSNHTGSNVPGVHNTGTIADQDYNNVSITGGSISGITDLAVADGGTGASTEGQALINLGADAKYTHRSNNLSDIDNGATAIDNLGALDASENLSDLSDLSAARNTIGGVPSGTKMIFKQSSAPAGWTFVAEDNDRVILNTSTESSGGTTGGSWTISGLSSGGHTLVESEIPKIYGSINVASKADGSSIFGTNPTGFYTIENNGPEYSALATSGTQNSDTFVLSFGEIQNDSHYHSISHNHGWRPSYTMVITCTKD